MDLEEKLKIIDEIKKASDAMIGEFINKKDVKDELSNWKPEKFYEFAVSARPSAYCLV